MHRMAHESTATAAIDRKGAKYFMQNILQNSASTRYLLKTSLHIYCRYNAGPYKYPRNTTRHYHSIWARRGSASLESALSLQFLLVLTAQALAASAY